MWKGEPLALEVSDRSNANKQAWDQIASSSAPICSHPNNRPVFKDQLKANANAKTNYQTNTSTNANAHTNATARYRRAAPS